MSVLIQEPPTDFLKLSLTVLCLKADKDISDTHANHSRSTHDATCDSQSHIRQEQERIRVRLKTWRAERERRFSKPLNGIQLPMQKVLHGLKKTQNKTAKHLDISAQ